MSESRTNVLCVVGTLGRNSVTHVALAAIAAELQKRDLEVDLFDPSVDALPLFNPESSRAADHFHALKVRVDRADVFVLGTPDYHGSVSSTLKNFLDHFWQEFAGRLFVPVVVSHEKGLTVLDQMRTVARQCYAWALPYGLSVAADADVKDGRVVNDALLKRIEMLSHDVSVYGRLLAGQARADLAGTAPGFLARSRKK